jgi:ribosome modulation factor
MNMRRNMNTAYAKGVQAANEGKTEADCPYPEKLTKNGRPTFSRAFRNCWLAAFKAAKAAE